MVDQNTNQGSFNGSFLVLNLGTNTLGVGSSVKDPTPSESLQPTPTANTSTPPNLNAIDNAEETVYDSSEEGSFSGSETSKSRWGSEGEEDPDWVPERKARRYNSSASKTVQPKEGASVISNPLEIPSTRLNGMINSSSGLPPSYLQDLLGLYGWNVVAEPRKGDSVFVSPQGIPYYSLSKAFETFLQCTSKYSDKAGFSSLYLRNSSFGGSMVERAAPSSSNVGLGGGNAADVSRKRRRCRKKQLDVEENIEPVQEQLQHRNETLMSGRMKSIQSEETTQCQEENKREVFAVRRSGRNSGKLVPEENGMNMPSEARFGEKANNTEQHSASSSENMLNVRSETCRVDKVLNNEVRGSDYSNFGVMQSRTICKARRSVRSRRPGLINRKNDVSDRQCDADKGPESNVSVGKEKGKSLASEAVVDEKVDCSMKGESIHGETKRKDCSSGVLITDQNSSDMHGCKKATRIRRSRRINGKHVPVDDDSDIEIGFDEYFLYPSDFEENAVVKNGNEKTKTSCFKDDELKQINVDNLGCQKSSCINSSASLNERNEEFRIPDRCFPSLAVEKEVASGDKSHEKKKKKRRGGCGLTVRRNKKDDDQKEILSQKAINVLSWLIDCGTLFENDKVYYVTKSNNGNVPSGMIKRQGIWCYCCDRIVTLAEFVAHAGGNLYLPWESIFLLSGKTLLLCLKEAWEKLKKQRKVGFQTVGVGDPDPSDDTCGVCADGGHLICCDTCPSTFHQDCLMLKALPEGSWYCPYCKCTFCTNMVSGSDMSLEALSLLSCRQCGRKYHKDCTTGNTVQLTGSGPVSFCGENCSKVCAGLLEMLGISNQMEEGFSWTLLKHFDEDIGTFSNHMRSFIMESNVKLSMALFVLDECFVPLIDKRTGVDMLCQAVYNCGSNFNRLNYEGFYTLILEKGDDIISVASLRLHGTILAEMPFVGTRPMYRRQGMCRRLLNAVENMLRSLQVEKLVIPAIPDLLETWTKSFSFKPLEPSHKEEINNLSLMVFAETTLLQKPVFTTVPVGKGHVDDGVSCEKKTPEMHEEQRTFGDQTNYRNQNGGRKVIHEDHEPPRSVGEQVNTTLHFGSSKSTLERPDLERCVGDKVNTTTHSGSNKSTKEGPELRRSVSGKINTRNCLRGKKGTQEAHDELPISMNGKITTRRNFGDGKGIQGGHKLPTDDQISTKNHYTGRKSMQEGLELPRSTGDKVNTRSLVGAGKSIQKGQDVSQSIDGQINSRNHFGLAASTQEGPEFPILSGDQINARNHFGHGKSIQEGNDARSTDGRINTRNPFACGLNTHEGFKFPRAFDDQTDSRSHFEGGKIMQDDHELPRSTDDQISTRNPFESCKNIHEGLQLFRDQISTVSIFGGGKITQNGPELPRSFLNQINTGSPFGRESTAQDGHELPRLFRDQIHTKWHSSAGKSIQEGHELPRSSRDQINIGSPFEGGRNMQEGHELSRLFGDQTNPWHLGGGRIQEGCGLPRAFDSQINASHFGSAPDWWIYGQILQGQTDTVPDPSRITPPSISSPFPRTFPSNLSSFPQNFTPTQSISAVLGNDPLGLGTDSCAVDTHMNTWSRGSDEVRDLQMDAIRSSLSFDNLLSS